MIVQKKKPKGILQETEEILQALQVAGDLIWSLIEYIGVLVYKIPFCSAENTAPNTNESISEWMQVNLCRSWG